MNDNDNKRILTVTFYSASTEGEYAPLWTIAVKDRDISGIHRHIASHAADRIFDDIERFTDLAPPFEKENVQGISIKELGGLIFPYHPPRISKQRANTVAPIATCN